MTLAVDWVVKTQHKQTNYGFDKKILTKIV